MKRIMVLVIAVRRTATTPNRNVFHFEIVVSHEASAHIITLVSPEREEHRSTMSWRSLHAAVAREDRWTPTSFHEQAKAGV